MRGICVRGDLANAQALPSIFTTLSKPSFLSSQHPELAHVNRDVAIDGDFHHPATEPDVPAT